MQTNQIQIPSHYIRLRTFCQQKNLKQSTIMQMIRRGQVPQALYSHKTKHYHLPRDLRIHLN